MSCPLDSPLVIRALYIENDLGLCEPVIWLACNCQKPVSDLEPEARCLSRFFLNG